MHLGSRGSWAEREKAIAQIRQLDEIFRRQDPDYSRHRREVVRNINKGHVLALTPFTGWYAAVMAEWGRVLVAYGKPSVPSVCGHSHQRGYAAQPSVPSAVTYHGIPIIFDDPINQEKSVKTKKQPKKTYNTCAVRFVRGRNVAKVYTYKVPKKVKLHLGEEVVVPSLYDGFEANSIAVVVELHKEPQDNQGYDYKFITGRITKVAA
jgi:hypothetical protein